MWICKWSLLAPDITTLYCILDVSVSNLVWETYPFRVSPQFFSSLQDSPDVKRSRELCPRPPQEAIQRKQQTFLTSFQDGDDWFTLAPDRFTPKVKTSAPIEQQAG